MQFELSNGVVITQEVIIVMAVMLSLLIVVCAWKLCSYQFYQPEIKQSQMELLRLAKALQDKEEAMKNGDDNFSHFSAPPQEMVCLDSPSDRERSVKTHSFTRVPDKDLVRMDSSKV